MTLRFTFFILTMVASLGLTAQWTSVSSPPSDFITDHTIGLSVNGKGYLIAGTDELGNVRNDVYEYDPNSDSFTQKSDFPGGARGFSIGDSWNGKGYVGFGRGGGNQLFNDLWEYDSENDEWKQLARCPCTPRFHPAFIAHNGKIFVGLGASNNSDLNDWWIYDIDTNMWAEGPDFPAEQRHHPYQFGIGDYVYTGFGHGGPVIYNDWYRFDPSDNTWTEVATLPAEGRVAGQQFSFNGKGYILSGEGDDHSAMNDGEFWEYDPENDSWEEMPSHPGTSRWAPTSFVIDNEAYLFNGIVYGFGPAQSMEEAFKYTFDEEVMSSVPELVNNDKVNLFPNPASDQLNIEISNNYQGKLIVADLMGRTVQSFDAQSKTSINTSEFSEGLYILKAEDGTIAKPFVVSHK